MPARLCRIAFLAALAATPAGAASRIYYKPGRWVRVPSPPPGPLVAPATTTVVENKHPEPQYVLPMAAPWSAMAGEKRLDVVAVPEGAWLVAELNPGPGAVTPARAGILAALPKDSKIVRIHRLRRGVPEAVDVLVCYDFSENRLQPQERAAVLRFVRRGGAAFFIFTSRDIPAASIELWRDLFGAQGKAEKQAPGLPRGLLVPLDFQLRFALEMPRLVWQPCGRGVVLAYGTPPKTGVLEDPAATAKLFTRAVEVARRERRPVAVDAVEPDVFGLFGRPGWSRASRRRFVGLALGYAAAAVGLLLSFGALLVGSRRRWLGGAALLAVGGATVIAALTADSCGLALDTASVVLREPGTDPVEVVFARITRLGPGPAPRLPSEGPMPPRLVLDSRYSAARKNWVNYRFGAGGATVEPLLDTGQFACFVAIRPISSGRAEELASLPAVPEPENGAALIGFVERRWGFRAGRPSGVRWVRPLAPPRAFDAAAERRFAQVRRAPVLVVGPQVVRVAAGPRPSRMGRTRINRELLPCQTPPR